MCDFVYEFVDYLKGVLDLGKNLYNNICFIFLELKWSCYVVRLKKSGLLICNLGIKLLLLCLFLFIVVFFMYIDGEW